MYTHSPLLRRSMLAASLCLAPALLFLGCGGGAPSPSQTPTKGTTKVTTAPAPDVTPGTEPPAGGTVSCQVLVVGGGTGGTAAALAAAESGADVCIAEETSWLGGQFTSQGLGCSDDGPSINYGFTYGMTARFIALRDIVRQEYGGLWNPSGCWVSHFGAEPRAFVRAISRLTNPSILNHRLRVFYGVRAVSVLTDQGRVTGAVFKRTSDGLTFQVTAAQVIDGTDLGDVVKLSGAAYRIGQEPRSDTGEADAPLVGNPDCLQSFTYLPALERRPAGESHIIPKPPGYGVDPWMKGFNLRGFKVVDDPRAVFTWRRLRDSSQAGGAELAVMNWPEGNDYWFGNIVDATPEQQAIFLEQARQRALGFVYWLQTEADGTGYPFLQLSPDTLNSSDGLSLLPYYREGRRIRPVETIRVEDVSSYYQSTVRARNWPDSLGIGEYPFDMHRMSSAGTGRPRGSALPYQIPLGALVPETLDGLIAGGKALGTTHMTNSAYRVHPAEWSIGEAAGYLAAYSVLNGVQPRQVLASEAHTRSLQAAMILDRVPLYWVSDVPQDDAAWGDIQLMATAGVIPGRNDSLAFDPETPLTRGEAASAVCAAFRVPLSAPAFPTFPDVDPSNPDFAAIETCFRSGYLNLQAGATYDPAGPATTGFVNQLIQRASGSKALPGTGTGAASRRWAARTFAAALWDRLGF